MAKTDNLAILITDIVGFTESTVKQTRSEQRQMMSRHNRIMHPLISRFRGRLVKSFGDGVLATFRSPTNALRCAMAIQDALTDHNRSVLESERIQVRAAINVGEVRVEKDDVFGEAVNLAARVETVVPSGEVYFTEAVYLAMNKAEISSENVGSFELKGIPEAVNIYRVPQHVTQRLVSSGSLTAGEDEMPFGGMHLVNDEHANTSVKTSLVSLWAKRPSLSAATVKIPQRFRRPAMAASILAIAIVVGAALFFSLSYFGFGDIESKPQLADGEGSQSVGGVTEVEQQAEKHLLDAASFLESDDRKSAAASIGKAFSLNPSLSEVDQHAQDLVKCLSWGASVATPIIRENLSDAMIAALVERTTQSGRTGAGRAMDLLKETGNAGLVDWPNIALNDLLTADSCEEKAAAATKLGEIGMGNALPALKELRGSSVSFMFKRGCGRSEANEALKAIDARLANQ